MGESAAKYRPELDLDEFERRLRAAAPSPQVRQSSQAAPDPLAELARLVGGAGDGARRDPFEALFRAQKAVAETHPLVAPHEPYFAENAAPGTGDAHGYTDSEPRWAPEFGQDSSDAAGEASWAAQDLGPEYAPQAEATQMQGSGVRGSKRVVYFMAALLVAGVALFAGGLALKKGASNGDVVTIEADSDPARIKPATQENAGASSGQALFDRKDDNAPAKVVSKNEQPADLSAAAKQAQAVVARQAAAAVALPAPAPPVPVSLNASAPAQPGDGVLMAPKKVKTISVHADGSLLNGADAPQPSRSTLPSLAAGFPGAASTLPTSSARPAAPRAADHAAPPTTEAALRAPAKPKPAADKPSAVEPAAAGDWAVQLSSEPGETEARASANRYATKYGAALQGHHPTFTSAQLGDHTVYRVRIGRLSKDSADSMCAAIKGQGGACFITKN